MSKRGKMSGGSVTGGTGDIKPQLLTIGPSTPVADQYSVAQINLPVPRIGSLKNKATVTEILKVWFFFGSTTDMTLDEIQFLSTQEIRSTGNTSTSTTMIADAGDPAVFAFVGKTRAASGTPANTVQDTYSQMVDLTDNNGNGIIVGTDRIFYTIGNASGGTQARVKILYRMVNITIQEYVGIVQSQQ
jgi:hypothetical protein